MVIPMLGNWREELNVVERRVASAATKSPISKPRMGYDIRPAMPSDRSALYALFFIKENFNFLLINWRS
jgi:hypothetical protein